MVDMDVQSGDNVYMMLKNTCVGTGCVSSIDPNASCSGTKIGEGNVSLIVDKCLKDVELPFHTMDTKELRCAIWSAIHWPKFLLRPLDEFVDDNGCIENEGEHMQPDDTTIVDALPITSLEIDVCI